MTMVRFGPSSLSVRQHVEKRIAESPSQIVQALSAFIEALSAVYSRIFGVFQFHRKVIVLAFTFFP
jgi:hypothetical protein